MRKSWRHTVTRGYGDDGYPKVPVPVDALSAPTNDDLIAAAQMLWPTGAAWGSPDGEAMSLSSVLGRFTRVLIDGFVWLYARAYHLALESSPQGANELLADWERDHGLPQQCLSGDQSTQLRLAALSARVRSEPVVHPEDFIRIAAHYGYEIEIVEPCIFECAFSECGGFHETGDVLDEAYWLVRVKDAAIDYFECGVSECGYDPLFDLGDTEQVLCLMRELAPGWSLPIAAPWVSYAPLSVGGSSVIIDDHSNLLLMPAPASGSAGDGLFIFILNDEDGVPRILNISDENGVDYILTGA